MNDSMFTDRSGRTLKEYRELFWQAEKQIKTLQDKLKDILEILERAE